EIVFADTGWNTQTPPIASDIDQFIRRTGEICMARVEQWQNDLVCLKRQNDRRHTESKRVIVAGRCDADMQVRLLEQLERRRSLVAGQDAHAIGVCSARIEIGLLLGVVHRMELDRQMYRQGRRRTFQELSKKCRRPADLEALSREDYLAARIVTRPRFATIAVQAGTADDAQIVAPETGLIKFMLPVFAEEQQTIRDRHDAAVTPRRCRP